MYVSLAAQHTQRGGCNDMVSSFPGSTRALVLWPIRKHFLIGLSMSARVKPGNEANTWFRCVSSIGGLPNLTQEAKLLYFTLQNSGSPHCSSSELLASSGWLWSQLVSTHVKLLELMQFWATHIRIQGSVFTAMLEVLCAFWGLLNTSIESFDVNQVYYIWMGHLRVVLRV